MTYRIHRRDEINKGDWYFTVECKGCAQAIYVLDDNSKGAIKLPIIDDGTLSIPCMKCLHEDIYSFDDLKGQQAHESRSASYPARTPISNSSRKPIKKFYPGVRVTMGVGFIEDRPKASMLVGRIVTSWADIEIQYARLLAELMQTNVPAVLAVFSTLRTSQAQSNAVTAVGEIVLEKNDLKLLHAYNNRKAALAKERNDLAHGCFGISVAIPDHIIWISQADFIACNAAIANGEDLDLSNKQYVYELGTLERIAQEIIEFHHQVSFYIGYLSSRSRGTESQAFRKTRYPQLCDQPHIKQEIQKINKKNKLI
ncbi:MAG: hypothetical protein ACOH2G_05030 [Ewingella sp.]